MSIQKCVQYLPMNKPNLIDYIVVEKLLKIIFFIFKIDFYEDLAKELDDINDYDYIESWLKCDLTSFKDCALIENQQWNNLYKDYLNGLVVERYSI